jgi:hypothetical protein
MVLTNREKEIITQSLSNTIKIFKELFNPSPKKLPVILNLKTARVIREYGGKLEKIITIVNKNPENLTHNSLDIIMDGLREYKKFIESQQEVYPAMMYLTGNKIDEMTWRKSNKELSTEVDNLIEKLKVVRVNSTI